MPISKYEINLSSKERKELLRVVKGGKHPARAIMRANILLASDRSGKKPMTVAEIAATFNTTHTTIQTVKREYTEHGLERAVTRKKRATPPVPPKITGEVEAHIIAMACGEPPKGYAKWTLRLLAAKCVELGYVSSISHTAVGSLLKKTSLSRN